MGSKGKRGTGSQKGPRRTDRVTRAAITRILNRPENVQNRVFYRQSVQSPGRDVLGLAPVTVGQLDGTPDPDRVCVCPPCGADRGADVRTMIPALTMRIDHVGHWIAWREILDRVTGHDGYKVGDPRSATLIKLARFASSMLGVHNRHQLRGSDHGD